VFKQCANNKGAKTENKTRKKKTDLRKKTATSGVPRENKNQKTKKKKTTKRGRKNGGSEMPENTGKKIARGGQKKNQKKTARKKGAEGVALPHSLGEPSAPTKEIVKHTEERKNPGTGQKDVCNARENSRETNGKTQNMEGAQRAKQTGVAEKTKKKVGGAGATRPPSSGGGGEKTTNKTVKRKLRQNTKK